MASNKHGDEGGVPVRLDTPPDHRVDGVAVQVPEDASVAESKSGQKAATKEKN